MNEKWFALSLSEIEKKLKTNAASGLSRKAARSRWSAEKRSIFGIPIRHPLSYLGDLFGDFAFIMLAIMSILALCFGENETGTVAVTVIFLNLAVAFFSYYRSEFLCDSLEQFFLPRCKVIRGGKLYSIDGSGVVSGDVIMLSEGDIIPCDARLVTSDRLKVRMLVEKNKYVLLDKAAEARVAENENNVTRYDNIVHAASVVVSGSARAIVTELGGYTYIGAKLGRINVVSKGRRKAPKLLARVKKFFSKLSFILLVTVLPFSVICMLFGNTTLSLFTAFMTALAVAAGTLVRFSETLFRIFYTLPMRSCLSAMNPSVIRSCDAMDRLSSAGYLFVLDGAALSDGILHYEGAYTIEGKTSASSNNILTASVKRLGEFAALYDSSHRALLSTATKSFDRYDRGIEEFIDNIGADREALKIRCTVSGFSAASENTGDLHDKIFYTELGERYMLTVSFTDSIINECMEAIGVDGIRELFSENEKQELMSRLSAAERSGKKILIFSYCRHSGEGSVRDRCFVGALVLSERPDPTARRALAAIEAGGTKPVYFRNTTVDGRNSGSSVSVIPDLFGSDSVATISDFVRMNRPVGFGFGKISSYDSLSDVNICELIDAAHAKGESVAVMGFWDKFERIYEKADVVISCSSDEYALRGKLEEEIDLLQSPDDLSRKDVPQTLKQRSDVIVPRPDKSRGGGCASLLSAFIASRRANVNAAGFFRYLICIQIVRMVLVMIPMLFGSTALDSRHILLGGFFADMLVMFSYATDKYKRGTPSSSNAILKEFSDPVAENTRTILVFVAAAVIATVWPYLISVLPFVPKFIDFTEYGLVVFMLFHIVVFMCMRFGIRKGNISNLKRIVRMKPDALTVIYPSIIIIMLIGCFFVPYLSDIFDIEGFTSAVYFFAALIPPALAAIGYYFFG